MLELYRGFKACGRLRWTKTWLSCDEATPTQIADKFASSVATFSSYNNVMQPFHGAKGGYAPPLTSWIPPRIRNGHDFVRALDARAPIGGWPPGTRRVDRELDCLRVNPTAYFPDGSVANEAIVPDLLLCSASGFAAIAEVKVRKDRNAAKDLARELLRQSKLSTLIRGIHIINTADPVPPADLQGLRKDRSPSD